VAKVYPELVGRERNGRIDGVRYDELAPMLLDELQKQHRRLLSQAGKIAAQAKKTEEQAATIDRQAAEISDLKQQEKERIAAQDAKIRSLEQQVAGLVRVQSKDQFVAKR
jgi:hypothetical protein